MHNTKRKPSYLRLAYWNACSVNNKKPEIETFLQEHNIDIFLISETFLRPQIHFNIANYVTYRYDRDDGPGGGTAILVKRNISHVELQLPDLIAAEANAIMVHMDRHTLKIISFYSPGARTLLLEDLDALLSGTTPILMAGDYNAKHRNWNS